MQVKFRLTSLFQAAVSCPRLAHYYRQAHRDTNAHIDEHLHSNTHTKPLDKFTSLVRARAFLATQVGY